MDRNAKRRPQKSASKGGIRRTERTPQNVPVHFADGFRRVTAGYIRQFCPSLPFSPYKNFPPKSTKKPACAGRRAFMLQKSAD